MSKMESNDEPRSMFKNVSNILLLRTPDETPQQVSIDILLSGGTHSPVSIRDYMSYLQANFTDEHLEFLLWHQRYKALFEKVRGEGFEVSTEWDSQDEAEHAWKRLRQSSLYLLPTPPASSYGRPSTANTAVSIAFHESDTPPQTPYSDGPHMFFKQPNLSLVAPWEEPGASAETVNLNVDDQIHIPLMFDGAKELQDSISHALDIYFQSSNRTNRELNLSNHDKFLLLYALQHSNHPTAFNIAVNYAYTFLRNNFPEFVKQAKQNANPPRQYFAIGLSQVLAFVGVAWAIGMTVACNARWIRVLACPFIFLGVATWYGGLKGSCIVLYGLGRFQAKPWDVEGKGWRTLYKKRWYIRKVFDRELVVSEPAIRKGQNVVFFQGLWLGFVVTAVIMAACLPAGEKRFFF